MRRLTMLAAAAVFAAPAAAQMPDSYRQVQMEMLRHQRATLLAMADSMPERLYSHKVTPPQRSFAAQITHAAGAAAFIMGTLHNQPISLPDTATAHASRAGLRAYIIAAYDGLDRLLQGETAAQRAEVKEMFGQSYPLWRWWDEIHMHTSWTTGQVVADFRLNGMAPPAFSFF